MIARGKFMAARAGLKKWRADRAGDDDGYFRTLDNRPGPKTKLLPDEERVWAETNALDAETQYGKDARQSCRSLNAMCDEEALLASWRELVSTSAKSIGRSPANVQRYLTEAEFQVEILSPAAVSEILTLVNSVATNPVARDRVQALIATGLHNPALRNPVKLQIRHTLSRAALNAVLQAL